MTTLNTQLGIKVESTYGTPVTVDRFYEYESESMETQRGRIESPTLRSGSRVMGSARFSPTNLGASGSIVLPVPTKSFGLWLRFMMGAVATGGAVDSNYAHTGTIASLLTDFFTMQLNRPLHPAGTNQAFTFHGCKVTEWELACDVDGHLMATIGIDAEDVDTSTGLATASYVSDFNLFSFAGASITVAGSAVEARNFKVACNNNLDTDRRYLRGSQLKKEPTENGHREITWEMEVDFTATTQYDRFVSATASGALAEIVATFQGPVAHAGSTLPSLVVTLPAARFDSGTPMISGPEGLRHSLSGVALDNLSANPCTIVYTTSEATA